MKNPETLTTEETVKLLNFLHEKRPTNGGNSQRSRYYLIAVLMLDAGLRVGEVVRLLKSDVYFDDRPVANLVIRKEISKSKRERIIPVSHRLYTALHEYRPAVNQVWSNPNNPFLFARWSNEQHLSRRQVQRVIGAAARNSIGRWIHPHVLRHTFASRLMRLTNARNVQVLLGHANLSSTQVYMHPNGDDLRHAIDAL